MIFSYDTFLVVGNDDRSVFIRSNDNSMTYIITPFNIVNLFVSSNVVKIKKKGTDNIINVPFSSELEAKRSLAKLNEHLDILRNKVPFILDKGVKLYVDDSSSGSNTFTFHQTSATNSWGATHGLGFKPNVSITDDSFEVIEGLVTHTSNNSIIVQFNQNITGWIICS